MSSAGDDPNDQPDGSYYDPSPAGRPPGLLGGQYAEMMANAPPAGMMGLDAAALGLDDTGLPLSVVLESYFPQLSVTPASGSAPSVDSSFISGQEGGQQNPPYALNPASRFPNAGVTVATGVDLGSHTEADLRRWGVSDDTIRQLTPYFGMKGQAAIDALNDPRNGPIPTIRQTDLDAMDKGVLNDTISGVQKAYDAANPPTSFFDLTPGQQTAIVDLAYQYGTNLAKRTPNFWGDVTSGNWDAAVNELNNFGDLFSAGRRKREALRIQGLAEGN
jgi:hypothetical protein